MAKGFFKGVVATVAVAGAAYLAYKNKDKLIELKNTAAEKLMEKLNTENDTEDEDDELFEEDDDVFDTDLKDGPIEAYDTTDDGKVDTVAIDNDGDGRPDELIVDTTGDGKADTAFIDTTGDGIVDTAVEITEE